MGVLWAAVGVGTVRRDLRLSEAGVTKRLPGAADWFLTFANAFLGEGVRKGV